MSEKKAEEGCSFFRGRLVGVMIPVLVVTRSSLSDVVVGLSDSDPAAAADND